jgi:hypothetical protein
MVFSLQWTSSCYLLHTCKMQLLGMIWFRFILTRIAFLDKGRGASASAWTDWCTQPTPGHLILFLSCWTYFHIFFHQMGNRYAQLPQKFFRLNQAINWVNSRVEEILVTGFPWLSPTQLFAETYNPVGLPLARPAVSYTGASAACLQPLHRSPPTNLLLLPARSPTRARCCRAISGRFPMRSHLSCTTQS